MLVDLVSYLTLHVAWSAHHDTNKTTTRSGRRHTRLLRTRRTVVSQLLAVGEQAMHHGAHSLSIGQNTHFRCTAQWVFVTVVY